MAHSRANPSARAWRCALCCACVLAACTFETSPLPPLGSDRPDEHAGGGAGAPRMDAGTPVDAAMPPGSGDAGDATPPPPPNAMDAAPDAASDAATSDAAGDAAHADAAEDAANPDDDGSVDEELEDAGDDCGAPAPCVCPHQAVESSDPCAPEVCAIDDCAPDDHCRYLTRGDARYYFCDDGRSWQDARDRCASIPGMRLVTVDSAAEDAFILANVTDKTWLGGSDSQQEGLFRWTDGTAFYDDEDGALDGRYVNWHTSEPNNIGLSITPPDCLLLWYENSAWADGSCGDQNGYVCELDP